MLNWQLAFTFCIYINVALFPVSARTAFNDVYTEIPSAYTIASKAYHLKSTRCGRELQDFRNAVDQRILWSLKVLDSSGTFRSDFFDGNNYWLGSRRQCLDTRDTNPLLISQREILNNTLFRNSQNEFPPFQVNYFVAHFRHNSTLQYHINVYDEVVITLGLCLPASCSINELSFILKKIFHDRVFSINDLYSMDFQLIQIKDLKNDYKWLFNGVPVFICICLGIPLFMTIIGTTYDILYHIFVPPKNMQKNEINKINDGTESNEININLILHRESKIGKVLICFSAYTNTKEIFNMELGTGTIPAFHALKFLTMCVIIICHIIYFSRDSLDNEVWLFSSFDKVYSPYIILLMFIGIDIFFFSNGCLVTYWYLYDKTNVKLNNSIDYKEKLIEFFSHIINRFIRLTPAYMMVLGLLQLSSAWLDKISQFYMYERSHEICSKYWWRNFLYINNFFGVQEMCMSWSWYLANDMQLYVITLIILILSTIHFRAAVTVLSALSIGFIILSGYISYLYEYVPTKDELIRFVDVIYITPWMRMNPYIIGIISGHILTKLNNTLLSKEKIMIGYCLFTACTILILFGFYMQYISVLTTAIFITLYRIFAIINIAWILIICHAKYGGMNELLSFKGWIPLGKLTYCAYLLHPLIIRSIQFYSETPMHFEISSFIVLCAGYITITYICSYILSVMVEIPCILLIQTFIRYPKRTHRKVL